MLVSTLDKKIGKFAGLATTFEAHDAIDVRCIALGAPDTGLVDQHTQRLAGFQGVLDSLLSLSLAA